jgi:hypothetical protein
MKLQDIKLDLIHVALVAIVVFFGWKWYQKSSEVNQWKSNYETVQAEHKQYVSETDGRIISYQKALILTEEQLKEVMWSDSVNAEMAKRYKKLAEQVTVVTEFVHDTIEVPVPYYVDTDTIIPFKDSCLSFNWSLSNGLTYMTDLTIPNKQSITLGMRKNGLRKAYWAVDVSNSNPCIQTTNLQSFHVVRKKKWFENPLVTGTIGIAIGAIGWEVIR